MSIAYHAFILVFFLLTIIVFLAWYDFIVAFNKKGTTSIIPLNLINNNTYGYLAIKEDDKVKGLAFNTDSAELYFTSDESLWQDFIYNQNLGLLKANDQRIGIVYFNDIITLSNIQNTQFNQNTKLRNNNLILQVQDRFENKNVSLELDHNYVLKPSTNQAVKINFYFIIRHG